MGSLFGKDTTKYGVGDSSGTKYYGSGEQAAKVASSQLPSVESMVGGSVLNPTMTVPQMPKITKPTLAEAQNNPRALTKFGAMVSLIGPAMLGAAAGSGERTMAGGSRNAANLLFSMQQANQEAQDEAMKRQLMGAQIAALPWQMNLQRQKDQAQIDYLNAGATRRENFNVKGVGLITPDSSSPEGYRVLVPEKTPTKPLATPDERKALLAEMKQDPNYGLSPQQEQEYVLTGKFTGIKPPTSANQQAEYQNILKKTNLGVKLTADEEATKKAFEQVVDLTKIEPSRVRSYILTGRRPVSMEDPETGAHFYMRAEDAISAGPNAYGSGTNFSKNAFLPRARFRDIDRATTKVDSSVGAMEQDNTQRLLIADALNSGNHMKPGVLSAFLRSKAYKEMSPLSRDYVTSVLSAREQVMGLNQLVTGSAQSSDPRTQAIWNTLPDGSEPDSDMARKKMDLTHGAIENLRSGYPLMGVIDNAQKNAKGGGVEKKPTHRYNPKTSKIEAINAGR